MFQVAETKDGSHTLINIALNQSYHSMYGALQESVHVFIKQGFHYFLSRFAPSRLRIFEMGYGTGLNAMLTYLSAKSSGIEVMYTTAEAFPVGIDTARGLNYSTIPGLSPEIVEKFHLFDSDGVAQPDEDFKIRMYKLLFEQISIAPETIDVVYYDAFSPGAQPELWTSEALKKCFDMLNKPGVWVTYSSKGDVRRALASVGFMVEKIPGPAGKREMLRALKL
ncbi:MAG: tRNA (5-methylaminomethyl-2-thiouridine)(34)-methyltransferase MnmD [Thermaurantimonas sp.]